MPSADGTSSKGHTVTRGRALRLGLVRIVRQPWRLVTIVCAGMALAVMDEYVVEPGGILEFLLSIPVHLVAGIVMWGAAMVPKIADSPRKPPETVSADAG
jgi:hypothetical protein